MCGVRVVLCGDFPVRRFQVKAETRGGSIFMCGVGLCSVYGLATAYRKQKVRCYHV
jgi:hypothetical protein